MTKKLFEQYRDTKLDIERLTLKLEELKPQLIEEMHAVGTDKLKLEDGSGVFNLTIRKTWEYSEFVEDKELALKDLKVEEQSKGVAKATESTILVFSVPKGD